MKNIHGIPNKISSVIAHSNLCITDDYGNVIDPYDDDFLLMSFLSRLYFYFQ